MSFQLSDSILQVDWAVAKLKDVLGPGIWVMAARDVRHTRQEDKECGHLTSAGSGYLYI